MQGLGTRDATLQSALNCIRYSATIYKNQTARTITARSTEQVFSISISVNVG